MFLFGGDRRRNHRRKPSEEPKFLYEDALSSDNDEDMLEMEFKLAQSGYVEVDRSLYTNAMLSVMSTSDTGWTLSSAFGLLLCVAVLQYVLTTAILSHVQVAMSLTESSITRKEMQEMYADLLNGGRLDYVRLDKTDVQSICGDFDYNTEENTPLEGTNWSSHFYYKKAPVASWLPEDIPPPTHRSQLDNARYVLENDFFICVFLIVTFVWVMTVVNEYRVITQFFMSLLQMEVTTNMDEVFERDGEELTLLAMTPLAKCVGFTITMHRFLSTTYITVVGCCFLLWTTSNIDLILNALALTFLMELDHITYNATIAASRQELIATIKRLHWVDTNDFFRNHPNVAALLMGCVVLGGNCIATLVLRRIQEGAYTDYFSLAAAICLFQGPTPGYWSQYHTTFPAPGICETVLRLKCETPIVGESGTPCVEDWTQLLCKFYADSRNIFNTWNTIDWQSQGPCLADFDGELKPIMSLDFEQDTSTYGFIARTCQAMWQRRPLIIFKGQPIGFTGPRVRVYPYLDFLPAGPFWCDYGNASSKVLGSEVPAPMNKWPDLLAGCRQSIIVYSPKASSSWISATADAQDQKGYNEMENMTEDAHVSPFSGIWLSKKIGVVVIACEGPKASVSNANLPDSPVRASIVETDFTMKSKPPKHGKLRDGKIFFDDGDVWISQQEELKEEEKRAEFQKKHPWFSDSQRRLK